MENRYYLNGTKKESLEKIATWVYETYFSVWFEGLHHDQWAILEILQLISNDGYYNDSEKTLLNLLRDNYIQNNKTNKV